MDKNQFSGSSKWNINCARQRPMKRIVANSLQKQILRIAYNNTIPSPINIAAFAASDRCIFHNTFKAAVNYMKIALTIPSSFKQRLAYILPFHRKRSLCRTTPCRDSTGVIWLNKSAVKPCKIVVILFYAEKSGLLHPAVTPVVPSWYKLSI